MIDVTNSQDLRDAYLLAFDSFAIVPSDLVDHTAEGRKFNIRYARELLATLVQANLLTVQDVNNEGDVWQVANPGTYDSHTREEAEAVIDAWLSGTKPIEGPKGTSTTTSRSKSKMPKNESGKCLCGCGGDTKSNYKPGHDARHAGEVGRAVAVLALAGEQRGYSGRIADLLGALPTEALIAKANGIADKAIAKVEKKAKPADKPQIEQGIIKVGKKEFAATRTADGQVTYYEGDQVKQASKTAAKTFSVE